MPTVGGTLTVASAAGPALVARSQSASTTLTYASKASADTSDRFTVNADGTLQWGPGNAALDTMLWRDSGAASILGIQQRLNIHGSVGGASLAIFNLPADTWNTFQISGAGNFGWGPGGSTGGIDTTLYRGGANMLRTDDMILQIYAGGAAIVDQNAALNMSISGAPTTPFGGIYGVLATVTAQPQATTWNYAYGMFSQAAYAGSGVSTLSALTAMYTRTLMSGASPAGTVTQATSLWVDGPQSQASGAPAVTFTSQYGIFIGNQASPPAGLTIGTSYGLFINSQTGAAGNLWAIYSAGGKSAHAGSITIGAVTNPAFTVDVQGTLRVTGASTFAAITATAITTTGQILTSDGTAALPAHSFTSATTTGMYTVGATSEVSISYGGTAMIRVGKQFTNPSIGLLGQAQNQVIRINAAATTLDSGANASLYGLYALYTWAPTNEITVSHYAAYIRTTANDVNATGALSGQYIGCIGSALALTQAHTANPLANLIAIRAEVGSANSAAPASTVTQAVGVFANPATWFQNVTAHFGIYVTTIPIGTPTGGSQAVIGTAYGIRIQSQGTAGGTTSYGLYMDAVSGSATNWAIYSLGGNSAHGGNISIGAMTTPTATLDVTGTGHFSQILKLGGFAAQATTPVPLMSAVAGGNGIEFGHSNTAGYRSTIGAELASGRPFIAFSCAHGTTNNTFITQGFQGSIFQGDLAGGFSWNNIPVATAGTDNQVRVQTMSLSNAGVLTVIGSIATPGNISITGSAGMLDLSAVAATQATSGGGIGDKIALYGSTVANSYGFGMQGSTIVAYVPASNTGFALRIASGSGSFSSGVNAVHLSAAGQVTTTSAAGNQVFRNLLISTDTQPAFNITGAGVHNWGPGGTTVTDTSLSRSAVGVLTTTNLNVAKLTVGGVNAGAYSAGLQLMVPAGQNVLSNFLTATDTQAAFSLLGGGNMYWGPGGTTATDTTLIRTAASQLTLTGALIVTTSISTPGNISITGSAALIARNMAAAGSLTFVSRIPADTQDRFQLAADGTHNWGSGNAAADVTLNRSAAATLNLVGNLNVNATAVNAPGDLIASVATTRAGALLCNGQAVSRTTYAKLFAAIGTTYGVGDGTTTFNVPDLRGCTMIGAGQGSGLTNRVLGGRGGAESVTLDVTMIPSHNHGGQTNNTPQTGIDSNDHTHAGTTGAADRSLDHLHVAPSGSTVYMGAGGVATGQGVGSFAGQTVRAVATTTGAADRSIDHLHGFTTAGVSAWHTHTVPQLGIDAQGGGLPHSSMPPFLVVNWFIVTG